MVIEKLFTEEELGYQLCFVKGLHAYFSNLPPTEVWGDDWNDAPYEHNAGAPYTTEDCKVLRLTFLDEWVSLKEPCSPYRSSPHTVEEINREGYPWLGYKSEYQTWKYVFPGTTVREFLQFIKDSPAELVIPLDKIEKFLTKL